MILRNRIAARGFSVAGCKHTKRGPFDGLPRALFCCVGLLACGSPMTFGKEKPPQYKHAEIEVSGAVADEPVRDNISVELASTYLEHGTSAWSGNRKCISCHTNGTYLAIRPRLSKHLGPPSNDRREFFVAELKKAEEKTLAAMKRGIGPTQIAYLAWGLSEWDTHCTGHVSAETERALRLMFALQSEDGSWGNEDCWPPLESSNYHATTVAAMAATTNTDWLQQASDQKIAAGMELLTNYLRNTTPPHDYARVLLLWNSSRMPKLLTHQQQAQLIQMLWSHQLPDGGWALRSFATPEQWGKGNRATKLREEPGFGTPHSDGHMTGLAVLALRAVGIPADDPRLQRAVEWIRSNQRASGRWWTRSLNTDKYHFITYSGTCYALLALAECDALPQSRP